MTLEDLRRTVVEGFSRIDERFAHRGQAGTAGVATAGHEEAPVIVARS